MGEAGGGGERGSQGEEDKCKPTTDSHFVQKETSTQHGKAIILNLKKN